MLRLLKETWLPTAAFVGLCGAYATVDRDAGVIHYTLPITALMVVPFVWKSFVIRQGRPRVRRAILAGSAAGFIILWSEFVVDAILQGHQGGEGLGGLLVILIPFMILIAVLVGGTLASVAAFLQARLWPSRDDHPGDGDAQWDGAIGGALVATLVSPFAALALSLMYQPDPLSPGWEISVLTGASWLFLVPAGAWLGVKAVRRWKRIHA